MGKTSSHVYKPQTPHTVTAGAGAQASSHHKYSTWTFFKKILVLETAPPPSPLQKKKKKKNPSLGAQYKLRFQE